MNHDLIPQEAFVGLYEVTRTTGEEIARIAVDVILRLNIPMYGIRGQTDNGAANMLGRHSGVQAELKIERPLALYVYCGAHRLNLITQSACLASPLIRDALKWVHELGTLGKQSGKFEAIFSAVVAGSEGQSTSLRPLCPTRWTVQGKDIRAVLSRYESVFSSLEDMASNGSNTGVRESGLRKRLKKGKTVL